SCYMGPQQPHLRARDKADGIGAGATAGNRLDAVVRGARDERMEPGNRSDLTRGVRSDAGSGWFRASAAVRPVWWSRRRPIRRVGPQYTEWHLQLRSADVYGARRASDAHLGAVSERPECALAAIGV